MAGTERYMLTSALPYANGPIHLGHLAGAYLPGDIFARYCRLKGRDTLYICGSDEHGVPIILRARTEGKTPKDIVDRYHENIKSSFERFGMSFDYYGRTSSEVHHQTSQEIFRTLDSKDVFVLKSDKQLYDPEAKMFLADRFVRGTCPNCQYEDAYGDQCESCGSSLSPLDLIEPRSAVTDAVPILKESSHWYLPLGDMQPGLEEWINTHPEWRQNVLGQINSWFKNGLKDRAVTRDLPWGIAVPPEIAEREGIDAEGKVLYVWFDAPIGYISASREWAIETGDPEAWRPYWQDEDSKLFHFIGKDNIVFHCLIFPAMLKAHGDYVLPTNVPANEFLNLEGNKLSTSRNYAVWLDDYLSKFEPDALRYALATGMPESRDADFSWREFQARHNNELADIYGNFVNRTFTFVQKYFDGQIPAAGELSEMDRELVEEISRTADEAGDLLDRFQFKEATRRLMDLGRAANKYFNDSEPWKTRKSDEEACATCLNLCAQTVRSLAILLQPVLPFTSAKIWRMLNLEDSPDTAQWEAAKNLSLTPGHQLNDLEILFRKLEDEVILPEVERLEKVRNTMAEESESKEPNYITIDDFRKMELRTAKVLEAEAVPKTSKLLKLQIEMGDEKRQLIAGVAQHYSPEEIRGKTIVVVANLEPATIRGVESQGMLLAVHDDDQLVLVSPGKDVQTGKPVS